ncbi:MAG TPA: acetylglutamate kinase [Gammaproteobacteria bacterium]|nr:acetylglutamate kinase [Gammaproteobacteria bacterium]
MTRPVVVKCGGAVAESAADLILELADAEAVVVVHGAGPQISAEMERRGLEVQFVGGRRVTSREALEVVRESMAEVNATLCAAIGEPAVPLFGDEIGLHALQVPMLGMVGDPIPCAPDVVVAALEEELIPVVAPLAAGPLNVNADEMAAALAVGLEAERILFVTDVPGLLDGGVVVPVIDADEAGKLLDAGAFQGGIIPKLRAAITAAQLGVRAEIGATEVVAA